MHVPCDRILLLEILDAVGAAERDAVCRVALLRAAGFPARAVVVGGERSVADLPARGRVAQVALLDAGRAEVGGLIARLRPTAAIVASAAAHGGAAAGWLPKRLPAVWWPTAIAAPAGAGDGPKPRALPPLTPVGAETIEWAPPEPPRCGRARLPLWDGDYLLAAGPLAGEAGRDTLEGFAALADDWSACDLVVLAHPQAEFERVARRLGVAMRVHFAGPAPREAEGAWLASAAAVLVAGDAALSGGLVLRTLQSGAPLVPIGAGEPARTLASWLERNGAAPGRPARGAREVASVLVSVLERGPQVERAIARGRARAAGFDAGALATRLTAALAGTDATREAA